MEEEITQEVTQEQYRFKQKRCSCGCDLTDKMAGMVSLYRGVRPMGACPNCEVQLLLDASPESSNVVLDYELESEEEASASSEAPAKIKRSHHRKKVKE